MYRKQIIISFVILLVAVFIGIFSAHQKNVQNSTEKLLLPVQAWNLDDLSISKLIATPTPAVLGTDTPESLPVGVPLVEQIELPRPTIITPVDKTQIILEDAAVSSQNQLDVSIEVVANKDNVETKIIDANGNAVDYESDENKTGSVSEITIDKPESLKAGKYTLEVYKDNKLVKKTDFQWGVLALNSNKTVYSVGEEAYLQMAALNETGNTICKANLKLEITTPDSKLVSFSTASGSLQQSTTCLGNNVTNNPDYFAKYIPTKEGKYNAELINLDTGFSIFNKFTVNAKNDFSIERISATRINPFKSTYRMTLKVRSLKEFSGELVENLPASFDIENTDANTVVNINKKQKLKWQITIPAGQERTVFYEYQAPKVSPEFYSLGKAVLSDSHDDVAFKEKAYWHIASDAAFTATATGNWNIGTTWGGGCAAACTAGTDYPSGTDSATISSGVTVTVTGAETSSILNFNAAAVASGVTISGSNSLTLSGAITFVSPTATVSTTLAVGAGTLTAASVALPGSATASRICLLSVSTGTINISGNITPSGTAAQAQITSTGAATFNVGGNFAAGGTVTMAANTLLNLNGTGTQTIGAYTTYRHLTINKSSGTAQMTAGTSTINQNLTLTAGTLDIGGVTTTVTGTTTVSSTLNFSNNTGTKTLVGLLTLNSGSVITNTGNENITFRGGITNNSTTFSMGTGGITFTTSSQALNGSTLFLLPGTVTITGAITITNNSSVEVSASGGMTGSVSGSTWVNAAGATLKSAGPILSTGTLTATASTNIVEYNGAAQTVKATTYSNLVLSGSGIKTLTSLATINGTLTMSGTATATTALALSLGSLTVETGTTLTVGAFNFTVNGATSITGTLAFSSATGTKTFIGAVTINSGGTWNESAAAAIAYRGGIDNSGTFTSSTGTHTFNTNSQAIGGSNAISFAGTMAITGAITVTNNTTVNVDGTGGVTGSVSGSTLVNAAGKIFRTAGPMLATGTLTVSGSGNTIEYDGAAQTVKAVSYQNLILSGSGAKTLTSLTTISNDLSMSGSATATTTSTITVSNNLAISGTAVLTTGSIMTVTGNTTVGTGSTLAIGAFNYTQTGTTSITGTLQFNSATGTQLFIGLVTINSGGSWNNNSNNPAVTFRGGITHNGTTFSTGNGIYTFDTNNQAISGSSALTFAGTVAVAASITVTNNATINVNAATAINGAASDSTLLNANGATINTTGTIMTTGTLGASTATNTVNYNNAANTTIKTTTYHDLGLGVTSDVAAGVTYSIGGNVTVNGTLTVGNASSTNTDTLDTGVYILTLAGSGTPLTLTAKGAITTGTSTVNYTGTTSTVTPATYYNLGVGTTSDALTAVTYTLGGNTTVNNILTVGHASSTNSDTLAGSSFTLTLAGGGTPFVITTKGTFSGDTSTVTYTNNGTGGGSSTINLQVATSLGDTRMESITTDSGKNPTNNGVVVSNDTVISPGSHGSNDEWTIAARFPNVTVAQGATVSGASYKMTIQNGWDAAALGRVVKYWVSAQAVDDAPALNTTAGDLNSTSRARSTASAAWTQSTTTTNVEYTIDVTSTIQEIINRSGWVSGNSIVILVDTHEDTTTGEWQDYFGYDGTPAKAPKLDITTPSSVDVNIAAASYNNLTIDPSANGGNYVLGTGSSQTITVGGTFTPGDGTQTMTVTANTNNPVIDINGNMVIPASSIFVAPPSANFTIAGNFTNAGTFTHNSGEVILDTTGTSIVTGATIFNDFTSTTSGKTIKFQKQTAGVPIFVFAGTFTITGTSGGGNEIIISSDTAATKWLAYFNTAQPSSVSYANVTDSGCQSGTATVTLANSTNSGNNDSCWNFGGNASPNSATSLAQKTTSDVVISTGGWNNSNSIKFTASVSDPDSSDTLQLCVEKIALGNSFVNTEDSCGTGVAYSGSPVAVSVTISSITDATEYHWQARVKDAASAYSTWVSYDLNLESARDFGIDTTAPSGGGVYDGTTLATDISYNNGSLSSISANWDSFTLTVSGLNKYEYSIGTTAGGTDIVTWTDNTTSTAVTASGLTLQTSVMYFFNVRATDNATNVSSVVSSNGQLVAPSLAFTLSSSNINFNNLNTGNSYSDTENTVLTTTTNAYNGYVIRAYKTDVLKQIAAPTNTIPDFSAGSYAAPSAWSGSDYGFGYTSSDTSIQGSAKFPASGSCLGSGSFPCYAPFTSTAPGEIVADHLTTVTGSPISAETFTMTYKVQTTNIQKAGPYSTSIIYTIIPQY